MTKNNFHEIVQIFQSLSGLFSKPESLDILSKQYLQLYECLKGFNPDLADKLLFCFNKLSQDSFMNYQVEFTKLFIGPFGILAVPYGSFYLENGTIMGESTNQAKIFYEQSGLEISKDYKEIPDHIQTELEFLYYISHIIWHFSENDDIENSQAAIDVFNQFVEAQMRPWIRDFSNNIRKNATIDIFIVLADVLDYSIFDFNHY